MGERLVRTTAWLARPSTTTTRRSAARPCCAALGTQRSMCSPSGASVSTIAAISASVSYRRTRRELNSCPSAVRSTEVAARTRP